MSSMNSLPDVPADLILTEADRRAIEEGCWFDDEAASHAVDFIECFCTLTKGGRAGSKILLIDWQRDIVRRLFGWMRADGTRRFRSAYIEIPKKNGKSLLMSAIALYMLMADGEAGAEVYLAAVNSKQARIVFDVCMKMRKCSTFLDDRLRPRDYIKRIEYDAANAKLECVTADAESQDGFDSSCTIFDELHRQPNTRLWDVFEYAGSGRKQPILISITTAGSSKNSLCWKEHERARKILDGSSLETSHLAVIYAANRDDDIDDPATWRKANPSLGHTLSEEQFARDLAKVRESPSGLSNFLRLRLNIWSEGRTAFIRKDVWDRGNTPIDLESLKGQPCWGGLDVSSKKDLTSFALIFGDVDSGFTVLVRHWIPEAEAREREKLDAIPYSRWGREGLITIIPGPSIEYDLVVAEIISFCQPYKVKMFASDGWGASDSVGQHLIRKGLKPATMGMGYRSLSEPTKELERQALMGQFQHGGNALLAWQNSHAEVHSDPAGNIKLAKPAPASPLKIDGLASVINALYVHLNTTMRTKPSVYSKGKRSTVL